MAVAVILAWQRALFTLVFFGASLQWELGACGMNDMFPALLAVGGLLLVERRRNVAGSVLVAVSAGIKPYSFAWFPALIGYGGVTTAHSCSSSPRASHGCPCSSGDPSA